MFTWISGGLHHARNDQDSQPWSPPCEAVGGTLPALWFRLKMTRKGSCRSLPWLYFLMLHSPCVQEGRMWWWGEGRECFWLFSLLLLHIFPHCITEDVFGNIKEHFFYLKSQYQLCYINPFNCPLNHMVEHNLSHFYHYLECKLCNCFHCYHLGLLKVPCLFDVILDSVEASDDFISFHKAHTLI